VLAARRDGKRNFAAEVMAGREVAMIQDNLS
jgi:hypothetical protein